ncbi:MAG TPA: carboxylesterase family protein [Rhizomicrobium sp.]|nr:carboxylesterase family protein [Rhizomicrobium sp.]
MPKQAPVVNAPAGPLQGESDGALNIFRGIPYAAPPVRGLRWRAPVPLLPWTNVRKATAFGPACIQPRSKIASVYTSDVGPMSEDCLTLNIWTPADAHNAPVFVWIYGGALWGGMAHDPLYDGARMAKRGIVVVTINYRLGVIGWLAHPGLSAESPQHVSGNYGLLDQIAALRWVKDNIGAFGGDAANVTIAGESAGGLSVMYLMTSPEARGLFQKAIAESAYMVSTPELKRARYGSPSAEDIGARTAAGLQASNIAALRAMDAEALTAAAPAAGFQPFGAIDGKILPKQLVDVFDAGEQAHVPLLAGFNAGEIRSLRILAPQPPADAGTYEKEIRSRYGDLSDEFLRLYPSINYKESILATTRDALYGWTAERLVRKQTAISQPAYLYFFDHGYPAADNADLHAFHASELPYVFGTLDRTPPNWPKIPATLQEQALSDAMLDYWTSFARTGKPQAATQPDWPLYGTDGAYMDFTDAPHPAKTLLPGMYALHEEAMCRRKTAGGIAWNWNTGLASPKLPDKGTCSP